jgi:hypothetical protein
MFKRILISIALSICVLPAVAQSPTAPYSPWMLPHTPGFNQQLLAPTNVTANFNMTASAPVLRISCADCVLSLPPCAAGQTFLLIPAYPFTLSSTPTGPTIVPAGTNTWTIGASGGQPGASFSRFVNPFYPSQVAAIGAPAPAGCQWVMSGL